MIRFIVLRLASIVPTLWLVITLVFFLVRLAPGGPFDAERQVPIEIQRAIDAKYHLDDPMPVQYARYMAGILRGDLGPTFRYPNRTVNEILATSLPVSIELGLFAAVLALLVGVPLGTVAALRHNSAWDHAAMTVAMLGISVPRFVLAPLLVLLFSLTLYWLPVARWETWRHMVLPVVCAGLPMAAFVARLTRGGMLEVLRSDFIRTARAKGLPERVVVMRHALKGGLLPVVSYLGPAISGLLIGSLVIEKIFNIPGMGRYLVEAALNRDHFLISGVALVYGFFLMLFNALVDIAYAWLDPRIEVDA